ncbi:MAG: OmpH family outer membrane protein [Verrucomicrobiae bacterium]|nr:OmpH family outer membrane protein [Verrucomicrobiae bacterium]NNJ86230.1 OmpH family outer membrane protein [Akkermansiaceae bacterium]
MRTFSYLFFAVTMICCMSLSAYAENPKMATVDMQKLFKEYHRTVETQKRFNLEYAKIQKGVNERGEVVQRKQRMLKILAEQLKGGKLSDDDKSNKESEARLLAQELEMMRAEIKRYSTGEKQKVARLKAASMQGIMDEIRKKVINHAEKQGYDFVFDKSGKNTNQVTFFIYLKDAKDITAAMLKELNKFAPGANAN